MAEIRLIQGDCRIVLPAEVAPKTIDLMIADGPYGVSDKNKKELDRSHFRSDNVRRKKVLQRYYGDWDEMNPEQLATFTGEWLSAMKPLLKPGATVYIFSAVEALGDIRRVAEKLGYHYLSPLFWCKTNACPNIATLKQPLIATEGFAWLRNGKKGHVWNDGSGEKNWITGPICQGLERTEHKNQKPLWLIEKLVKRSSNPGDLIADPFLGSGTSAMAASRLGRDFIGCDINADYCEIARRRLAGYRDASMPTQTDGLPIFDLLSEATQ